MPSATAEDTVEGRAPTRPARRLSAAVSGRRPPAWHGVTAILFGGWAPYWRLLRLFAERDNQDQRLRRCDGARAPSGCGAGIVEARPRGVSPGGAVIDYQIDTPVVDEDVEARDMRLAIESLTRVTGSRPPAGTRGLTVPIRGASWWSTADLYDADATTTTCRTGSWSTTSRTWWSVHARQQRHGSSARRRVQHGRRLLHVPEGCVRPLYAEGARLRSDVGGPACGGSRAGPVAGLARFSTTSPSTNALDCRRSTSSNWVTTHPTARLTLRAVDDRLVSESEINWLRRRRCRGPPAGPWASAHRPSDSQSISERIGVTAVEPRLAGATNSWGRLGGGRRGPFDLSWPFECRNGSRRSGQRGGPLAPHGALSARSRFRTTRSAGCWAAQLRN